MEVVTSYLRTSDCFCTGRTSRSIGRSHIGRDASIYDSGHHTLNKYNVNIGSYTFYGKIKRLHSNLQYIHRRSFRHKSCAKHFNARRNRDSSENASSIASIIQAP